MLIVSNSFKATLEALQNKSLIARLLIMYLKGSPLLQRHIKPEVNYLHYRKNSCMISYMPKGKVQEINPDGTWSLKNRQATYPGRVIRKLFSDKLIKCIADYHFTQFAALLQGFSYKLTVEDSFSAYDDEIAEGNYNLNNSCMNGESDYMEIYEGAGAQLLTLRGHNGLLFGRAILWPKVTLYYNDTEKVVKFMDRVYTVDEQLDHIFTAWADENGYYRKRWVATNSATKNEIYHPDLKKSSHTLMVVKLDFDPLGLDYFPYLDTFQYYNKHTNSLQNFPDGATHKLTNTDGGITLALVCEHCDNQYWEGEIPFYDVYTPNGYMVCCDCCTVYDYYNDRYILDDESTRTFENRTCHIEEAIEVYNLTYHTSHVGRYIVLDDYKGNYILTEESIVTFEGLCCHIDDSIELHGQIYHVSHIGSLINQVGETGEFEVTDKLVKCSYTGLYFYPKDCIRVHYSVNDQLITAVICKDYLEQLIEFNKLENVTYEPYSV